MSQVVDIRKYNIDNVINDLINSSQIKKRWYGKVIDDYWKYLDRYCSKIEIDINVKILSDIFIYLIDYKGFSETLNKYSKVIAENRNNFVSILVIDDKSILKNIIGLPAFTDEFEHYVKELNGMFYNYTKAIIVENIHKFITILDFIDDNYGLIINIG